MKPGSEILVSCADRIVWVRVEGNGSSTNSTALRDFAKEMIHRGSREFIVDLCNCPVMDSTFMGTLAGISLWLGELGEGCLSVVNLNERNAESLWSLGLDQLFNVRVSAIKKDGQALPIPLEEDRTARAQTMLEAHEALIKTAPENLPKFKDVIQYLETELHLSKYLCRLTSKSVGILRCPKWSKSLPLTTSKCSKIAEGPVVAGTDKNQQIGSIP